MTLPIYVQEINPGSSTSTQPGKIPDQTL